MTSISAKIFEIFRNLKSDAVPRPPRRENEETNEEIYDENDENVDSSNEQEEIVIEPDNCKKEKKSKPKKPFFYNNKKKTGSGIPKSDKYDRQDSNSTVNTQATGNVINIVNSKDVRWGNDFVYYLGPTNGHHKPSNEKHSEETIEKCNLITLLMEAKIKPDHDYIDYVSKNLGKNWHSFFKSLGYTKGRIETVEIDESRNGVSEARYKLLLDWVRNDEDGTLGRLATLLWEEGERQIVKELAIIYKKNKK